MTTSEPDPPDAAIPPERADGLPERAPYRHGYYAAEEPVQEAVSEPHEHVAGEPWWTPPEPELRAADEPNNWCNPDPEPATPVPVRRWRRLDPAAVLAMVLAGVRAGRAVRDCIECYRAVLDTAQ